MILKSDDSATDMLLNRVGPDRVRSLIADLSLRQTRIPDSTRQYVGYVFGDPVSTADDLVDVYSRVLLSA